MLNMMKNARLKLKMTHDDVAKKLHISRSFVGHIERGIRRPTCELAMDMATLYKVDLLEYFPDLSGYKMKSKEKKAFR